ncbi:hypothetical protein BH18ACT17_BH18ACT17_12720 [soil metagenome]
MTVRELAWHAGAPTRGVLLALIGAYRVLLSGWLGGQCRFEPTCSRYAEGAIQEHGAVRGSALAAWRVARCNPFGAGGIDPVSPSRRDRSGRSEHPEYDVVVRDDVGASA